MELSPAVSLEIALSFSDIKSSIILFDLLRLLIFVIFADNRDFSVGDTIKLGYEVIKLFLIKPTSEVVSGLSFEKPIKEIIRNFDKNDLKFSLNLH